MSNTPGKAVARASGKRGVLADGKAAVFNSAGACPACCGAPAPCLCDPLPDLVVTVSGLTVCSNLPSAGDIAAVVNGTVTLTGGTIVGGTGYWTKFVYGSGWALWYAFRASTLAGGKCAYELDIQVYASYPSYYQLGMFTAGSDSPPGYNFCQQTSGIRNNLMDTSPCPAGPPTSGNSLGAGYGGTAQWSPL